MGGRCLLILFISASIDPTYAEPRNNVDPKSEAWKVLKKNFADGDPEHRKNAVVALGASGSPEAVNLIEDVLKNDKSGVVRQSAAITLGDITSYASAKALQAALDDDAEVSFAAAQSLEKLGDPSGQWILQEVIEGDRSYRPGMVHRAIRDVKHKAHNPTQLALMGAKEATGQLFGPASIGVVLIQMSLKEGGGAGKVAAVTTLAKDPGPDAVETLEYALQDKHWTVRAAAARALGDRGNTSTIVSLVPLLTDGRDFVRNMAAASIVKLSAATPVSRQPESSK
jgi:HEAT repeat protein